MPHALSRQSKSASVIAAVIQVAMWFPVAALASPEHDAMLFLESVTIPKQAKVCAAKLPGFQEKFDSAWPVWVERNQSRLKAGEAFMRAGAEQVPVPFETNVDNLTNAVAHMLESASAEVLAENCGHILGKLGGNGRGG